MNFIAKAGNYYLSAGKVGTWNDIVVVLAAAVSEPMSMLLMLRSNLASLRRV